MGKEAMQIVIVLRFMGGLVHADWEWESEHWKGEESMWVDLG
jgi:hypothetical protein